ncbi:hypothetical protein STANM309S_00742 [Streptomyces tanashiensis]
MPPAPGAPPARPPPASRPSGCPSRTSADRWGSRSAPGSAREWGPSAPASARGSARSAPAWAWPRPRPRLRRPRRRSLRRHCLRCRRSRRCPSRRPEPGHHRTAAASTALRTRPGPRAAPRPARAAPCPTASRGGPLPAPAGAGPPLSGRPFQDPPPPPRAPPPASDSAATPCFPPDAPGAGFAPSSLTLIQPLRPAQAATASAVAAHLTGVGKWRTGAPPGHNRQERNASHCPTPQAPQGTRAKRTEPQP